MTRSAPSARQPVYVTGKARHVSERDPTDGASSYDGASEGERLHVQLAPEPDFPISGAVALRAPDGGLLGYLGAGAAAVYHPLLVRAAALGYEIHAAARFELVALGAMTVAVWLPEPEELASWLDLPPEARDENFR